MPYRFCLQDFHLGQRIKGQDRRSLRRYRFQLSTQRQAQKIFDGKNFTVAKNINGYLLDAPNVYAMKRNLPLCDVPIMTKGNYGTDNGNLMIKASELEDFVKREPAAKKYIRVAIGGDELINGKIRYCLWLVDCSPHELRKMPLVYQRVQAVRDFRLASSKAATRDDAETPWLFQEIRQPTKNYIMIPQVSSERRRYVPMGFLSPDVIATAQSLIIPDATLYHFGILTSLTHMAWMRVTCGRLGISYRYSNTIVYNNFIWPKPTAEQKKLIETTAQKILDVRKKYPDSTLADLYDPLTMPKDLRAAHNANDKAVAAAYGFEKILDDELAMVLELFKQYEELPKN